MAKLKAKGIGTVSGKLYIGTADSIPPSELIDTTGAGDAFIGAVLYGNVPCSIFSLCPLKGYDIRLRGFRKAFTCLMFELHDHHLLCCFPM